MTAAQLQPGDRVRARVSTSIVRAGALGTVVQAYPLMRGAYEVHFDGLATSVLMWEDELEVVDQAANDAP
jgi:hypothetical protein